MNAHHLGSYFIFFLLLVSCQQPSPPFQMMEDETLCLQTQASSIGDYITIEEVVIPQGTSLTNVHNFKQTCPSVPPAPLVLQATTAIQHQVLFRFDRIYPVDTIEIHAVYPNMAKVSQVQIDFSTNGVSFSRLLSQVTLHDDIAYVSTSGQYAKAVKFTFLMSADYLGFADVRFVLGEGFVVVEDPTYSSYFLRTSGWSGADGIFSYDLTNGGDDIGVSHNTTGFVFSDTFVGEVNPTTFRRTGPTALINNSFGYLNHDLPLGPEAFSFAYDTTSSLPSSPIIPDAYIGHAARNLLDSDGFLFSHSPSGFLTNKDLGISWLSEEKPASLLLDFYQPINVKDLYIWNYNAQPNYGTKDIQIFGGPSALELSPITAAVLPMASGDLMEPFTAKISLDETYLRFLRLDLISSYDEFQIGLGKLIIHDDQNRMVFANIEASSTTEEKPDASLKPRLWLQDGLIANNSLYNFPLLIKNANGFFTVNSVGMIEVPIHQQRFDFSNTIYYQTPLMTRTLDNGVLYFGAGVMDHRRHDGYIYVYGYKDLRGRHLVVARTTMETLRQFNNWEFYSATGWVQDIHQAAMIKSEVSAELSVTRLSTGFYAGKYLLTVMKSTISGQVAYAIGNSPVGPFGSYFTIYQTLEHTQFKGGFTYNAKLHPNLSAHDRLMVSYNVNSNDFSTLMDARVYYPRFIQLVPISAK
jgi:hypothetical protein